MRAAVISNLTFEVVNVIEIEDKMTWVAPENCFLHFDDKADFGMAWNGKELKAGTPEDKIV